MSQRPVEYLSQFDVLQIRTRLAARLRASGFDELNLSGLQSALAAPRQSAFGQELQPTIWDKAAVLLTLLIKNHPFYDGNKRIALSAVNEFLRRNGWDLTVDLAQATAFTTAIAADRADTSAIIIWLQAHTRPIKPVSNRTKNKEQRTKEDR